MKTLKELIEARKCRKGESEATTKKGAFWLACPEIKIRRFGGDGIGQSRADMSNYLQLRHYRSGETKAIIHHSAYHQNSCDRHSYKVANLLDCTTIEDVIVMLKAVNVGFGFEDHHSAYSDWGKGNLTAALTDLGMVESAPAPDECDAKA